jgi:hypothetical protein
MISVYVTTDPQTGRALYHDERIFKGTFRDYQEAYDQLGDELLRYCSVYTASRDTRTH